MTITTVEVHPHRKICSLQPYYEKYFSTIVLGYSSLAWFQLAKVWSQLQHLSELQSHSEDLNHRPPLHLIDHLTWRNWRLKQVLRRRVGEDSTFFTLHTLHSTPFHIPQSTVHWCGAVTGENIYKTNQIIRFTKCFTWLHSSSWAASCLITMSVVHCTALRNKFYWTLDEFASTCSCDTTFKHLKTGWGNEQITCHCWFASCFVQGWTQSMVSLFFLVIAPLYLPAASVFHSTFGVGQGRNQSKTSDSPWHEKVSSTVVLKLKHVWLQAHR